MSFASPRLKSQFKFMMKLGPFCALLNPDICERDINDGVDYWQENGTAPSAWDVLHLKHLGQCHSLTKYNPKIHRYIVFQYGAQCDTSAFSSEVKTYVWAQTSKAIATSSEVDFCVSKGFHLKFPMSRLASWWHCTGGILGSIFSKCGSRRRKSSSRFMSCLPSSCTLCVRS